MPRAISILSTSLIVLVSILLVIAASSAVSFMVMTTDSGISTTFVALPQSSKTSSSRTSTTYTTLITTSYTTTTVLARSSTISKTTTSSLRKLPAGMSRLTVNTMVNGNVEIDGFYTTLFQNGVKVGSNFTPAQFIVRTGQKYVVQVEDSGPYFFQYWQDTGSVNANRNITAADEALSLLAVMCRGPPGTCPNATPINGITVYANRIPAPYWAACFALTCSMGTGPGASEYFVLYNSQGKVVQTAFADEHGYTFEGLNPNSDYFLSPQNCDLCHNSTHDVVFRYWGNKTSTAVSLAVTTGQNLEAWYSCTNGCLGY